MGHFAQDFPDEDQGDDGGSGAFPFHDPVLGSVDYLAESLAEAIQAAAQKLLGGVGEHLRLPRRGGNWLL